MRSLVDILKFVSKDTIYEKLDINKVNLKETNIFPIEGTIKEMIEFLERFGFKEINDIKGRTVTDFFNSKHGKCYWLRDKEWIYFGDTFNGDISPTNGLIIINLSRNNREYRILKNTYTCSDDYHSNTKEFLEILNKQFGWK